MLDPPRITAEWPVRGEGGAPAKDGRNQTGALATANDKELLSALTFETEEASDESDPCVAG